MDKFPEAFGRFEEVVDTDSIVSFRELHAEFAMYAGRKWKDSPLQNQALLVEWNRIVTERLGNLRGREQEKIYTSFLGKGQFSIKYGSFSGWEQKGTRSSAHERRIMRYMERHPTATLAEARGHRRK